MIYRSTLNGMIYEFAVPQDKQRGVFILLNGMPSVPKLNILLEKLAADGYVAIFPRYRGTWESAGQFLSQSPVVDIKELCDFVTEKKELTELYSQKKFRITSDRLILAGTSFGGAVALCSAVHSSVKSVIALSPVVSWENFAGEETGKEFKQMHRFISEAFGEAYRFNNQDWEKFESGKLFNPPTDLSPEIAKKIIILADRSDTTTYFNRIEQYAIETSISLKETKNIGHMSFSKIDSKTLTETLDVM